MKIEFGRKDDIRGVKGVLEKINDGRTVIMAPEYGDSQKKSRPNKLRVYSHGGRVLYLSTTRGANNEAFPDKKYRPACNAAGIPTGNVSYEILNEQNLRGMIQIAENRAKGELETSKTYVERSVETRLIKKHRDDKYGNGIIVDMEFSTPKNWMGQIAKYNGITKRGKPDLVIYDPETESFGLVELKYQNKSCENMEKHFADFYNIIHGGHAEELIIEFRRKMLYLEAYGIIDEVKRFNLDNALKRPMWNAFLFIGGCADKCHESFESTIVDEKYIDKRDVGFLYIPDEETKIDYSKRSFFL